MKKVLATGGDSSGIRSRDKGGDDRGGRGRDKSSRSRRGSNRLKRQDDGCRYTGSRPWIYSRIHSAL